jgi:hypothetical protein
MMVGLESQGSGCAATLGWMIQSLWDCGQIVPTGSELEFDESRRDSLIQPRVGRASDLPWVQIVKLKSTLKGLNLALPLGTLIAWHNLSRRF